MDYFTGSEDGGVAVSVGGHRGDGTGVNVVHQLLAGDSIARCAERLLEGRGGGEIPGIQCCGGEEGEEDTGFHRLPSYHPT